MYKKLFFNDGSSLPVREKRLSHFICSNLGDISGSLDFSQERSVLAVWSFCKRRKIRGANHNGALPSAFPVALHKDDWDGVHLRQHLLP